MSQPHDIGDPAELAALYAAGAMPPDQLRRFALHLEGGCRECCSEVERYGPALADLLADVPPVQLDSRTRAALLERAAAGPASPQVWRNWTGDQTGGLVTRFAGEGDWEDIGIPGITLRRLFVDRARNQLTMMVRMAAGTSYPRHVHDGPEECFVISGELHVGDELVMRAGDWQRAEPESLHALQWTETGCELLITSSLSDELV